MNLVSGSSHEGAQSAGTGAGNYSSGVDWWERWREVVANEKYETESLQRPPVMSDVLFTWLFVI